MNSFIRLNCKNIKNINYLTNAVIAVSLLLLFQACQSSGPGKTGTDQAIAKYHQQDLRPFYHGVASGDPLADRVIIWTRLTPEGNADLSLKWQVSETEDFAKIIQEGDASTSPERDYTAKVDVTGLMAGKTYFYRFSNQGIWSPVGRTKTLPTENPEQVKLAVVSCSNFEAGYFNAFARMADRTDIDAVLHLGDYIYEYGVGTYGDTTLGRINLPPGEILSVEDYRTRYSLYRLDADFRAVHQQHPFITIWDDHEFSNNAYVDGAQNHQADEGDFEKRKVAARQAYYEWLPIREAKEHYRSFEFGSLVHLIMLDERVEGRTAPLDSASHVDFLSADRSMLGARQLGWFKQHLQQPAQWRVVGNQVIFSGLSYGETRRSEVNLDSWDGWPHEQNEVKNFLRTQEIKNTIFVTGDTHSSWAFETPFDPENYSSEGSGNVAVEFGTTSISSANMGTNNPLDEVIEMEEAYLGLNPHLKYVRLRDHGYIVLTISEQQAKAEYYYVDAVDKPSDNESLGKTFIVKDQEAKLETIGS